MAGDGCVILMSIYLSNNAQHNDQIKIEEDGHSRFLKRDDITCPIDWKWKAGEEGKWHVDRNRAVDEEGQILYKMIMAYYLCSRTLSLIPKLFH